LVVEDDERDARTMRLALTRRSRDLLVASTVAEVRAMGADRLRTLTGAVIDLGLPDGSGLDLERLLRKRAPGLPVLLITATRSDELVNMCQHLDLEIAYKPPKRKNLRVFALRASLARRIDNKRLASALAALVEEHDIKPREQDVLVCILRGLSRRDIADTLGLAEPTVKMHIRSILKKTGMSSMHQLASEVLLNVWIEQRIL
jgi:DNA-binding NarL/FixJ family response regulator